MTENRNRIRLRSTNTPSLLSSSRDMFRPGILPRPQHTVLAALGHLAARYKATYEHTHCVCSPQEVGGEEPSAHKGPTSIHGVTVHVL